MWKRSHGGTIEAPPTERGGNRYVLPNATAPHRDYTIFDGLTMSAHSPLSFRLRPDTDMEVRFKLSWSHQFRRVKWFKSIDRFDGLSFPVPPEQPQNHLVWREVDQCEPVLLYRFYLLIHVEMCRWHRTGAAPPRRP